MPVGHRKTGGLDDMGCHVEARAKTKNRPGVLGNVRLEKRNLHSKSNFLIPGTPGRMPDVNDPDVSIFDEIMNAVGIPRDETAAQLRSSCVANTEMGSLSDQSGCIENGSKHPVGGCGILFSDIIQNFPEIVSCARRKPERHRPRCLNSAAISSADMASPRLAWRKPSSIAAHSSLPG